MSTNNSYPLDSETIAFIQRVLHLPQSTNVSLDVVLEPSIQYEARLRRHFSSGKLYARLRNPFVGLLPIHRAPRALRTTRSRVVMNRHDRYRQHILPLSENERRLSGTPSLVNSPDFVRNFDIFSDGLLRRLRLWKNVAAAGGAVVACMTPLPPDVTSPEDVCQFYRQGPNETSDIDLFLYDMTKEQAEKVILQIYEDICSQIPHQVTFQRTKYTISIYTPPPYRTIQIVLHIYRSPAEVLCSFDIDAACFLYDGDQVFANPRGVVATMRQANTVNIDCYSPQIEPRLVKYAPRGFEIYVPTLDRQFLDNIPYAILGPDVDGLARLGYLEWRMEQEQSRKDMERSLRAFLVEQRERYRANMNSSKKRSEGLPIQPYSSLVRRSFQQEDRKLPDCISFWSTTTCNSRFHPRTIEEWSAPAYLDPVEACFEAIRGGRRELVQFYLSREHFNPNERDASGKSALRLAIELDAEEIACDLLDAGAFPDFGMPTLLGKLVGSVSNLLSALGGSDDGSDGSGYYSISSNESDGSSGFAQLTGLVGDMPEPSSLAGALLKTGTCGCRICERAYGKKQRN